MNLRKTIEGIEKRHQERRILSKFVRDCNEDYYKTKGINESEILSGFSQIGQYLHKTN